MTTTLNIIFATFALTLAIRVSKLALTAIYILSSRKRTAQMGRLIRKAFNRGRNASRSRRYA